MVLSPADGSRLPEMLPGQFVEVGVETPGVLLRRPISINDVDYETNTLTLLVRNAGRGTSALMDMKSGDKINLLLPLGKGFTTDAPQG
ncbi:MAG: dihydroorotate dehydrogenase electron transfer subunit, partial [Duncaniella sp.]|nr:dihydroorotate dehydrogenase electron transfer subunit [Duncaniella sp.]